MINASITEESMKEAGWKKSIHEDSHYSGTCWTHKGHEVLVHLDCMKVGEISIQDLDSHGKHPIRLRGAKTMQDLYTAIRLITGK